MSAQHLSFGSEASLPPFDLTYGLPLPSLPSSAFSSSFSFPLPLPPASSFSDAFNNNTSLFHFHSQTQQEYDTLPSQPSPASPLSSLYSDQEEDCSSMASAPMLPEGGPILAQTFSSQTTCSAASSVDFDSDSGPSSDLVPGSPSSSDASSYLDALPSFDLGVPPPLPGVSTILERSVSATSMSSLPPLPIPLTSLSVDDAGRTSRDLTPYNYSTSFSNAAGYPTPYLSTAVTLQGPSVSVPYTPTAAFLPVAPTVSASSASPSPAVSPPAHNPYHPYSTRHKKRERPQPERESEIKKTPRALSSKPLNTHRSESKRPAYPSPTGFPSLCPFVEINDGVGVSGFNGACPINDYFVSLSHREWAAMDENASQSRRSAKCRMRVSITIPPSQSQPGAEMTLALCLNHGGGAAAKDRKYDAAFLTLPTMGPDGQPSYAVIRSRPEKRRSVWIVSAGEAAKFKHTVPSAMSLDQRGEYGLWFYNLPEGVEDYQVNVEVGTIAGCRARELAVEQNPSKKQKPLKQR